jgi:polyisoprenoid-binding protein YceI
MTFTFWSSPKMSGRKWHRDDKARRLAITRRAIAVTWTALLSVTLLAGPAHAGSADADQRFYLDQRFSSIDFSVRDLGLFASQGGFRRFEAHLVLSNSHPERTKISVAVDAGSVDMSWREAADMLRSPDFFDVRRYPEVRFQSNSVQEIARGHFAIRGSIQIRGVTQPLTLYAALTRQTQDPADHSEIVNFIVRGSLNRSTFGMTADEVFISDKVNIIIKARLKLPQAFNAD